MINLLPKNTKNSYNYARRNRHIFKWVMVLLFGIFGAVLLTVFGFVYLHQLSSSYEKQIAVTKQQLEDQDLEKINTQIKDMSNNLELATQVLSRQIIFSDLLEKLSNLLPDKVILTGLSVSETQGALDISAKTKDYESATQTLVNLRSEKNGIFSNVDIINTSCASESKEAYPCTVSLRALFAPDSKFAPKKSNNTTTPRPSKGASQ